MDKEKIKTNSKLKQDNKATGRINIRVTPKLSKWLKEKKYSPTGIFQEACKDLGYKDKA